jgi:hypothetical protein
MQIAVVREAGQAIDDLQTGLRTARLADRGRPGLLDAQRHYAT